MKRVNDGNETLKLVMFVAVAATGVMLLHVGVDRLTNSFPDYITIWFAAALGAWLGARWGQSAQ